MRGHLQHHLKNHCEIVGVLRWQARVEPSHYFLIESFHVIGAEWWLQGDRLI